MAESEGEKLKRVDFQYGVIMLRTRRFQSLMDRFAGMRISKPVGWFLLYLLPVVAGVGIYIFASQLGVFFSPLRGQVGTAVRGVTPLAYLGLPGINPYLPWLDGWIALFIAMVIHEGAHGIVARSLGLPVKSSGLLLFLIVPIGAFVEVDESALKVAKARDSGRVLAAGAGINFLVGIVALLLLFSVVSTMTPATSGIAVTQVVVGSPAAAAGVKPGDFITAVNGVHYTDPSVIGSASWYVIGQSVNLTLWRQGTVVQLDGVVLGTNPDNSTRAFLGVNDIGSGGLSDLVTGYTSSFLTKPFLYLCIPTFPQCGSIVPFSGALGQFYTSGYGGNLVPLATFLYWLFFLNFNLAVFNALPLYPLDGGQAFRVGVQALGGKRLSEKGAARISVAVALIVLALVFSVPVAAYLHLI